MRRFRRKLQAVANFLKLSVGWSLTTHTLEMVAKAVEQRICVFSVPVRDVSNISAVRWL
jgi:hypothetical protein